MEVLIMFSPLVIAATGSGIAPCMAFLNTHPNWPVRIVWSARFPEVTYGTEVMETVLKADPNAIIIDTKETGRPDMAALIYAAYKVRTPRTLLVSFLLTQKSSGNQSGGCSLREHRQCH
jgi:ferredoxin-NADP reductase